MEFQSSLKTNKITAWLNKQGIEKVATFFKPKRSKLLEKTSKAHPVKVMRVQSSKHAPVLTDFRKNYQPGSLHTKPKNKYKFSFSELGSEKGQFCNTVDSREHDTPKRWARSN